MEWIISLLNLPSEGNENVVGVVVAREIQNGGSRLARRLGGWHTLVI